MKGLCALLLLLPLVLGGAAPVAAYTDDISAQTAYDWLNPGNGAFFNPNALLLDVRTPQEWVSPGHPGDNGTDGAFLEGHVINLPVKVYNPYPTKMDMNNLFDEEALSRFAPSDYLLVMCASGGRSVTAANILFNDLGFTHVYNVLSGFSGSTGWYNSGLPYNTNPEGMWVSYSPAPAPATILLLGSGLLALGVGRGFWRR